MKRFSLCLALSALAAANAFSGDVANFVNLGFSPDGKYFMFGCYGIGQADGRPYAELYAVDTAKNEFVPDGVKKASYDAARNPGQDGSGALYSLFSANVPLARRLGIDHLAQGRILYVLLNGSEAPADLAFRDFSGGDEWLVSIAQSKFTAESGPEAAFSIAAQRTSATGAKTTLTMGNPKLRRQGVSDYAIRQIILAPGDRHLVAIVEKRLSDKSGPSVRYMVETAAIK